MRILKSSGKDFRNIFDRIRNRGGVFDDRLEKTVRGILEDVRRRGDAALAEYSERFDGVALGAGKLEVTAGEIRKAVERLDAGTVKVLKLAARRIGNYHRKQVVKSWSYREKDGVELGQRIRPLDRVGIYAPGGLAPYPSTVLMAAVPAKMAGVREIILATPPGREGINPLILAAARIGGVTRIFRAGGAQAIAALAFGTRSVPAVDKIVGPGNAWVAMAKRLVYGTVGIDMIAGPSEIMVICDGTAKASVVAADLLSQAEHDEMASSILLTTDAAFAREVDREVRLQMERLDRREIARRAIEDYGLIILVRDLDEAVGIANGFAPEHLEIMVKNPRKLLGKVRHAGAVFLGPSTPEVLGDYVAGTNHILPTGGTARFSSPLGVYDFVKRTSVLSFTPEALRTYGPAAEAFARIEGLGAHSRSIAERLKPKKS